MSPKESPPDSLFLPAPKSRLSPLIKASVFAGLSLLLLAAAILLADIVYEALGNTPPFGLERWSMILIIIAFIVFFAASVFYGFREWNSSSWRHVAYQVVAFLILGLSLSAFGLHNPIQTLLGEPAAVEAGKESLPTNHATPTGGPEATAKNIAEIAAVMVLFVLAELAAFVGHDVYQATRFLNRLGLVAGEAAARTEDAASAITTDLHNLKETTERIRQLRLVTNIATLHPTVQEEAVQLVHAWGERVPAIKKGEDPVAESGIQYYVSNLCWRILLKEYLTEELQDIAPEKIEQGIPKSVRPLMGTNMKDVSFIATNVGFYAKFLSSLVEYLSSKSGKDTKLCMAIVTNALPAHCWDWPMPDGNWRGYHPIDSYRWSMLSAVEKGAQIDRVLLVYEDAQETKLEPTSDEFYKPYEGIFWRRELLDQMLTSWQILSPTIVKEDRIDCSIDFAQIRGDVGEKALQLFPLPIKTAATKPMGSIYPMIVGTDGALSAYTDQVNDEWKAKKLASEYSKLHGDQGMYWRLPLNKASLALFEGRHDIMFIGLGKGSQEKKGLWTNPEDCEWGICLMSSMNATTETMFLTILSGASVREHHQWCKKQLDDKLNWSANRLNPRPEPPLA